MRVFVPVEDSSIERDFGALVPYRQGLACVHALREGFVLDADGWLQFGAISDGSAARRPDARPACLPDRH
jgi:hypothetical protein